MARWCGLRPGHQRGAAAWSCRFRRAQTGPCRLGDAHPGHPRRGGRGADRAVVQPAGACHHHGCPCSRRARPRRCGRLGGSPNRRGLAVRRALRHGGRRLPDPRAEPLRRSVGGLVGAGHRGGALPAVGGGAGRAVAAPTCAPALLAQGRRCGPGHRPDRRRRRSPAHGCHRHRPCDRARPARGVVRP
jgi:hypothetical protein